MKTIRPFVFLGAGLSAGIALVAACSDNNNPTSPVVTPDSGTPNPGPSGSSGTSGGTPDSGEGDAGGPVTGAQDRHCYNDAGVMTKQPTSAASCHPDAGPDAGDNGPPDYGDTMFNSAGNDDDCKYSVSWTSTPIFENTDVFFTVVATTTVDGQPATGAKILSEVFLSDTHPSPSTNPPVVESPPGTYKSGPIRFDAPGQWTVRFHLHEDCSDLNDDSPHGHAAFFVQVP